MPSIAIIQYAFGDGTVPFAHNFLVLYDDQGNVLSEFHGNPADPATRKELDKYIGRSSDNLGAFEKSGRSRVYVPGQQEKMLWQGSDDAMARRKEVKIAATGTNRTSSPLNL